MTENLKISETIQAKPEDIYNAWLDGEKHSEMTGSKAIVELKVNGMFTAWDGYIEGKTIEMSPHQRIVQKWRTTDFPSDSPDSKLEIILKRVEKGTRITLVHSEIPEGQADEYRKGWQEFYFDPMKRYFEIKSD
ncbi:MAG: hypothetical protein AM326_07080 [Candidatus Thorarchaeota archaeon SMTZ-45]|nr:MAG: hypothetical protein AM325_02650 [Candidatus Thorarchaeota archaeon SMTZ1-45]KXH76374.1 MAG: hypothetical protein AM326_07080 [Candidatus Thorarchaeota archaeon SMTZ-45]